MTNVVRKKTPHGTIPFIKVRDAETRGVIMQLNENVESIKRQLEQVQQAVVELQRR